jgi:hypothetical protein
MFAGDTALRTGGRGCIWLTRSALPDFDVLALFPCLEMKSSDEAMMEAVVLMLNVLWESPPVPTMSH